MECLDIVPGISQLPQSISRPGSCHMRLHSGKPQSNMSIRGPAPATELDLSPTQITKPVKLIIFNAYI